MADAAMEQGLGIVGPLVGAQLLDDPFVTGQLNVPAQQDVGCPHDGVEPVDGKQQKAQRFPPVVSAADVGALVGDDVGPVRFVHMIGEVDLRLEDAEDEGGVHILA